MTFQEAEKTYKDLKLQHSAGKITDADFESQVNQLKAQDPQGRWWQLGVRTGEWYYNDGQKWVKGKPPIAAAPIPPPAAASENQPLPSAPPSPSPAPAPAVVTPTEPQPAVRDDKPARASIMPRGLFAPKPEGSSGGGMSRPMLIGIIAVAAVLVIALLVGGYFLLRGGILGGTTARATTTLQPTPSQAALLLPTLAASPTIAATDTPAPTATQVVTATNPGAARPTNTRAPAVARTATPTKAAAPSATPAPPPGVYVTNIAIDRTIEVNTKFGFRVTFFNNSGGPAHKDNWLVLVYRDSDYVEGSIQRPFGQTQKVTLDIPVGKSDVLIPDAYQLGTGGPPNCTFQAEANYIGDNNIPVPYTNTNGKVYRFRFSFCQ